jgi:predicted amidohydrolase YtcJ
VAQGGRIVDARRIRRAAPVAALLLATLGAGCGSPEAEERTAAGAVAPPAAEPADLLFVNAVVRTMDDARPTAEAVAVGGGRILAVGDAAALEAHRGEATEVVDLEGRTLLPGFVDSHGHVVNVGLQALAANLLPPPDGEGTDVAALVGIARAWLEANRETAERVGVVVGFGYDDAQLAEQRHPVRQELDRVSTELPVVFIHQSGHLSAVNSKALALAGLTADSPDPEGGLIRREAGGREPNGVLEETASFAVLFRLLAAFTDEDQRAMLRAGAALYARYGYTTAQEGRALGGAIDTLIAVAEEGGLPIDVVVYPDIVMAADRIAPPWYSRAYRGRMRIGGAKLNLDGSPQGKTAWLTEPYFVPPEGQDADYRGYPTMSDEEAAGYVEKAFANGWQILAHVNGDAAIDQFVAAVRAAEATHGRDGRRPVAIHAQTVREDQLDAFQELGIFPSIFPMHTFYWGDWHRDSVLGKERAYRISPARSIVERGMRFGTHHDAPVGLPDSMRVLSATVTRVSRSGDVIGPDQRVSPEVALKAMTLWPAWQHFEEDTKGSLEPGKLADLVVLSADPVTIDPMEIDDIEVLRTIKEGRTIYAAEQAGSR